MGGECYNSSYVLVHTGVTGEANKNRLSPQASSYKLLCTAAAAAAAAQHDVQTPYDVAWTGSIMQLDCGLPGTYSSTHSSSSSLRGVSVDYYIMQYEEVYVGYRPLLL